MLHTTIHNETRSKQPQSNKSSFKAHTSITYNTLSYTYIYCKKSCKDRIC